MEQFPNLLALFNLSIEKGKRLCSTRMLFVGVFGFQFLFGAPLRVPSLVSNKELTLNNICFSKKENALSNEIITIK